MPDRPKILHTMTWLAPGGGVDRNVYLTMRDLSDRYEMHLAVGCEIHHHEFDSIPDLTLHVCPHLERRIRPVKDFRSLLWFARLIREEEYVIVHTHEAKASLIGRLAARMARCPFVIYGLHGVTINDPVSPLQRWVYRFAESITIGAADQVVSVSQDAIDHYHRAGIGEDLPSKVVYSGIELDQFVSRDLKSARVETRARYGLSEENLVFVNVGRFSEAKAQRFTIEAFAKLAETSPTARLLLVGEGPVRNRCEAQCRDLGVEDRVVFTGFQEDVVSMYAAADIHVLTSLREGLPRVVVEASLCEIPTVSFEVEGVREVIEDKTSGYVVGSGNVDALVDRMQQLAADGGKRTLFARNAFEHARKWDHRKMVAELDEIYRNAV
jgi:glycosyltransferase involved in cell wall biosynthesis